VAVVVDRKIGSPKKASKESQRTGKTESPNNMAIKISELPTLSGPSLDPAADFLEITDTSAGSSKKIAPGDLVNNAVSGDSVVSKYTSNIGFLDEFDNSVAYPNGGNYPVHLTTMPEVGAVWRVSNTDPSKPPVIANRGVRAQTGSLIYIGSSTPTTTGRFVMAAEITLSASIYPASVLDNGCNMSYGEVQLIHDDGSIDPNADKPVHINFSRRGIESATILPSTSLTCLNATNSGSGLLWNPTVENLTYGKKYTIIFEAEGDILRITMVGVGSLVFTHPDLSTKIGSTNTYFWWEAGGDLQGVTQYKTITTLNRISAGAESLLANPSFFNLNSGYEANKLTGATLAPAVVNSSLTNLGTLSALTVTGLTTLNGNLFMNPSGSSNRNITFGTGFDYPAITLYDGGTGGRYGWGLRVNEIQHYVPTGGHFSWNKGGDLQASGTNELMRLDGTTSVLTLAGSLNLPKTITASGTTGAQTINKPSGSVNFAAAATSLVVTNSLVTANSIIQLTVASNDLNMSGAKCIPAAGSFTIYPDVPPAAETKVLFSLTN